MTITGKIYGINGPVIYVKGDPGFKMSEMVYVGKDRLVGEVIALSRSQTIIQVYEETTGLKPGEEVIGSGDAIFRHPGPWNYRKYIRRRPAAFKRDCQTLRRLY